MYSTRFQPIKFLGSGCYSLVYSVATERMQVCGEFYALKRFFIRSPETLLMAMHEYNILKRLVAEGNVSPFLPILYYSMTIHQSPVLVLNRARDITLDDIITIRGPLNENQARNYISEIICGLRYLHELNIVHMELRPNNILVSESGHLIIADFDRSFDLSERKDHPQIRDFNVNQYYAAPEIAREQVISDKADVWSVGVLMADLIGESIRPIFSGKEAEEYAKKGRWHLICFSTLSRGLKQFFQVCFTVPYVMRPSIAEVQRLEFFKEVNWMNVQALQTKPPFTPSELNAIADKVSRPYNPSDPLITNALFESDMPVVIDDAFHYIMDSDGNVALAKKALKYIRFDKIGYSPRMVEECMSQFNFVHPSLLFN